MNGSGICMILCYHNNAQVDEPSIDLLETIWMCDGAARKKKRSLDRLQTYICNL